MSRELDRVSPSVRDALPGIALFVALVGTAFEDGGYFPGAWAATAVGFLWLAALAQLLGSRVELSTTERVWLGLFAGVLLWTALSLAWSVNHSETLLEIRRSLVYLAGVSTVLLLATRRSTLYVLSAVWASATVVVVSGLAHYLLALRLQPDDVEGDLLFQPLGYANALGIFAGLGAVLSLGLIIRAPGRAFRTLACAAVAPLAAAVYLTSSRATVLAIGVGVGAMLLVERDRLQFVGTLVVIAPLAAAVVGLAARSGLTTAIGPHAQREGRLLALWILIGAVALALARPLAEEAARWTSSPHRRARGPALTLLTAAVVLVATIAALLAWSGRFFAGGFRPAYWHVAWREYDAHPWLGSGAGTFGDYWVHYGNPAIAGGALDAHNLYLETLAELGPIGLGLLVLALALPLVVAPWSRDPLASTAIGAYVAFLFHAALDWDWEMPTVTLAGLGCAAALLLGARTRAPARPLSIRLRVAALGLTLALAMVALAGQFVPALRGSVP